MQYSILTTMSFKSVDSTEVDGQNLYDHRDLLCPPVASSVEFSGHSQFSYIVICVWDIYMVIICWDSIRIYNCLYIF